MGALIPTYPKWAAGLAMPPPIVARSANTGPAARLSDGRAARPRGL